MSFHNIVIYFCIFFEVCITSIMWCVFSLFLLLKTYFFCKFSLTDGCSSSSFVLYDVFLLCIPLCEYNKIHLFIWLLKDWWVDFQRLFFFLQHWCFKHFVHISYCRNRSWIDVIRMILHSFMRLIQLVFWSSCTRV